MSTNNPEPLYDGSLSLIEPAKRAFNECTLCNASFFGPGSATDLIEHECDPYCVTDGRGVAIKVGGQPAGFLTSLRFDSELRQR